MFVTSISPCVTTRSPELPFQVQLMQPLQSLQELRYLSSQWITKQQPQLTFKHRKQSSATYYKLVITDSQLIFKLRKSQHIISISLNFHTGVIKSNVSGSQRELFTRLNRYVQSTLRAVLSQKALIN